MTDYDQGTGRFFEDGLIVFINRLGVVLPVSRG